MVGFKLVPIFSVKLESTQEVRPRGSLIHTGLDGDSLIIDDFANLQEHLSRVYDLFGHANELIGPGVNVDVLV